MKPATSHVGKRRRRTPRFIAWCVFLGLGCSAGAAAPTGGETHFLTSCEANAECGDELSCLGEVCTSSCSDATDCDALPSAECAEMAQGDSSGARVCDVPCSSDDDCSAVSPAHRCTEGACRAPSSASSCPPGEVAGNQVLVIGDSFLGATHQVTAYLEDLARTSGALEVGERYRDNSAVTANALGGGGIASQYDAAVAEAPVEVVIMDGGGTDILVGTCDPVSSDCQALVDANQAAADLLQQMSDDEVTSVVYVFYPDYEDDATREKVDALRPLIEDTCAQIPVPCHFLDLRPTFADHLAEYTDASGILPSDLGAEASARAIWSVMQDECIAQ